MGNATNCCAREGRSKHQGLGPRSLAHGTCSANHRGTSVTPHGHTDGGMGITWHLGHKGGDGTSKSDPCSHEGHTGAHAEEVVPGSVEDEGLDRHMGGAPHV